MATTNLSAFENSTLPIEPLGTIGIVVSEWNSPITEALLKGAKNTLLELGYTEKHIVVEYVPGSFELTYGCKAMINTNIVDAIIAIGCVIRGETPHFEYVCQGITFGITNLNIKYEKPVIFCVLTTSNQKQAEDRAGGKHGNKGVEAAITAIKMLQMKRSLQNIAFSRIRI